MNREEILKQAILNEIDGYEFYKMFAKEATNPEIRELFMLTANEELSHIDFLKQLLEGKKAFDFADIKEMSGKSPEVFKNPELQPGEVNTAMAAFSIGVNMEEKSAAFYKGMAEKSDDEEIRKLFTMLADWEEGHRDAFKRYHESLKTDWWNENRFSPY